VVGEQVAGGDGRGGGDKAEKRNLVVQFTYLVGSTAMSEVLDAEDVREVVLAYQKMAGEVIKECGGHIAQFLGDGILTYFGFPVAHEDAAVRGCQAALDILAGLDGLNAELLKNGINPGAPVAVRLGMHVGSVGCARKMDKLQMKLVSDRLRMAELAADEEEIAFSDDADED